MLKWHYVVAVVFLHLYMDKANSYSHEFLALVPPVNYSIANAVKTDVLYYLFDNHIHNGTRMIAKNVDDIISKKNIPAKVFIHGYTTDPATSPWYDLLKDEYFLQGPHNIIYVDWSKAGNVTSYLIAAANVRPVGQFVADFLMASKIPLEYIHVIGHSLGSHVAGFVGKYVFREFGEKIARVTALDPAFPAFDMKIVGPKDRICSTDGKFVDVIHTDIGHYGFIEPIGDVDFYPNGGCDQVGCTGEDYDENCSHARSTHFFVDSINNLRSKACKAKFMSKFKVVSLNEPCANVTFGDRTPPDTKGMYYLKLNITKYYPYIHSDNKVHKKQN